jgi:hypothetical protein
MLAVVDYSYIARYLLVTSSSVALCERTERFGVLRRYSIDKTGFFCTSEVVVTIAQFPLVTLLQPKVINFLSNLHRGIV